MRKAFFCYEQLPTGNWSPVVYFDEMPQRQIKPRPHTEPVVLKPTDFTIEAEPQPFSILQKRYPRKEDKDAIETNTENSAN
jgi:hypothetical protein